MRSGLGALVVSVVISTMASAIAEPDPAPDQTLTPAEKALMACLEHVTTSASDCIGTMVEHCPEHSGTTVEILSCIEPELQYWEKRLDRAYLDLLAFYEAEDSELAEGRPLAPLLQITQEQWVAWREAKCGFEYNKFRGGSLGRITGAHCRMEEAGHRALELEDLLSEVQL